MLGTFTFCDGFSYSIYSFAGLPTCPYPRPYGGTIAFAPPGTFVLGVPAIGLSGCSTIGVGTCPVVYDPYFMPIAGYVGSIEGLTYEANCSGALDSELCIAAAVNGFENTLQTIHQTSITGLIGHGRCTMPLTQSLIGKNTHGLIIWQSGWLSWTWELRNAVLAKIALPEQLREINCEFTCAGT